MTLPWQLLKTSISNNQSWIPLPCCVDWPCWSAAEWSSEGDCNVKQRVVVSVRSCRQCSRLHLFWSSPSPHAPCRTWPRCEEQWNLSAHIKPGLEKSRFFKLKNQIFFYLNQIFWFCMTSWWLSTFFLYFHTKVLPNFRNWSVCSITQTTWLPASAISGYTLAEQKVSKQQLIKVSLPRLYIWCFTA